MDEKCKKCGFTDDRWDPEHPYFCSVFNTETRDYEELCRKCLLKELVTPTKEGKEFRNEFFSDLIGIVKKFR
jgi:hypothetical protein